MSRRQRLFFKAGCWAALLTAVMHLVGHLAGPQPPATLGMPASMAPAADERSPGEHLTVRAGRAA